MCHADNEMRKRELPNHGNIKTLGVKENYKYLGMLEVDTIEQTEIKEKGDKRVIQNEKTY